MAKNIIRIAEKTTNQQLLCTENTKYHVTYIPQISALNDKNIIRIAEKITNQQLLCTENTKYHVTYILQISALNGKNIIRIVEKQLISNLFAFKILNIT
ncbi:hypothetical protein EDL79_03245 [Ehrlichia ruminantium]|uniref:Uncharacterized protein n=1 Tax=Ehrlichia ruminantium TaxID=779 RepID=A0AAE6QB75_EHRRU|nr:hypothetical protein [Ehrlichia ruminantium]QGR02643.1 hypothetical protein EDL81_03235 [Ehrlichia ruminantium]QGR03563.1 hypothetical protein EDL80_03235 [Ehrlichia ruminantium]QGR04490.1 hypothetical protein EDL79_03245 [Ehrlichia ruminantium]